MRRHVGLDFGTTNSSLAVLDGRGAVRTARFRTGGGGTTDLIIRVGSDFSLLRVGPGVHARLSPAERILGNEGVGLAGDSFDSSIIRHMVSPRPGAGSSYRWGESPLYNPIEVK